MPTPAAMDYLISKYDSIKDSSPTLLKSSLEAGETVVYWVKDKTVTQPMEMVITSMEERKAQIRGKWESSNAQLQSRMNDVTAELKKRSDSFQLQCVEGVNNVLDYIEFSLENYTLPPSDSEGSIFSAKSRNQLVTATALLPMTLFLFLRRRWRWPWRGTFNFLASTTGTVVKKSLATASIELRLARDVVHRSAQSLVYVVLRKLLQSIKDAAEEASAIVTMRRMWELTYRVSAGSLKYATGSVRTASEPIVNQLHKHLHPGHVRIRVSIIRDESFLDRDDFERNDDLTAIDRRIIVSVTRPVVAKATAVYETTANIVGYPKRLIAQVKSLTMKDVKINGLRATNIIVGGIVERFEYLKKNQAFHNLLTWTERKEKFLIGAQD